MDQDREFERCGFILNDLSFIACSNVADDPANDYRIDPLTTEQYLEDIVCVIHSHPNGKITLSPVDMLTSMPMFLYGIWAGDDLHIYECNWDASHGLMDPVWEPVEVAWQS